MSEQQTKKWNLVSAMWSGVANLFPTRKTKLAMWGVVGLGVLITYMELVAAQFFGRLITNIGVQSASESGLFLVGFLMTFAAIKALGYFQSVYRLTIFEKSLRKTKSAPGGAEAWRWPMAIALVGMLGQIGRLLIVTITVTTLEWAFGILLFACSAIAVLIVSRSGRRQYAVHQAFAEAKKAGNPPSAAERIGTRVRAGERAGLGAVIPVLVFVAALGIGALEGRVPPESALVLFIAARMSANMYGTLATTTMRYIRSEASVDAYGATARPQSPVRSAVGPDEQLIEMVATGGYLWEPPAQAFARLIDDGYFFGDVERLGHVARQAGFRPKNGVQLQEASRPANLIAVAPNQVWRHQTCRMPLQHPGYPTQLQVALDVFSRAIVSWRFDSDINDTTVEEFLVDACGRQGVSPDSIEFCSERHVLGRVPNFYDLLKSLGVFRTMTWGGPEDHPASPRTNRPRLPPVFRTEAEAEVWVTGFIAWYNHDFYQPDVGYLHPSDVHGGLADVATSTRRAALDLATSASDISVPVKFPAAWLPPDEVRVEKMAIVTVPKPVDESEERTLDEDEEL
jgi:hypothetical protein